MTEFVPDITGVTTISPPFGLTDLAVGSIEEALIYLLWNNTDLTEAVSLKVYPSIIPQNGVLPCLTYQQISGIREQKLDGALGFVTSRFQINCWSKTYAESSQVAELVRLALESQNGWTQGVYICDIQLEDESDMPQVDAERESLSRYGIRLDFQVFFNE